MKKIIIFIISLVFCMSALGMNSEQKTYLNLLPRDIIQLLNPLVITIKIEEAKTFDRLLEKLKDISQIKVLYGAKKLLNDLLTLKVLSYSQALEEIQTLATENTFAFNNLSFTELLLAELHGKSRSERTLWGCMPLEKIAAALKTKGSNQWLHIRPQQEKLIKAAEARDLQAIQSLVDQGVDTNTSTCIGQPILVMAAWDSYTDVVALLIAKGAYINTEDAYSKDTALKAAACVGNSELVKILINAGADLNVKDRDGYTALHLAARNKRIEAVELLIKAGADLNTESERGDTPMDEALGYTHNDVVGLLALHGARINKNYLPLDKFVGSTIYTTISVGVVLTKKAYSWFVTFSS